MLYYLRGTVAQIHPTFCILDVSGVGYKVNSHPGVFSSLAVGHESQLYLHEQIREDTYELYGFLSMDELTFFKKLLNVSGIGPKVALAVCAGGSHSDVLAKILRGDLDWLSSIPGIGKKTAQKIILELKGQLVDSTGNPADNEVMDALINLGYSSSQAKEAVKNLPPHLVDPAARIREALKALSR